MRIKHTITSRYKAGFVFLIFIFLFALAGLAQENADEYKKTIEMADNYFTKGDYINAKASYQIAVRLAPEDQYPKDRLQQSLDLIRQQMYQNSLYQQKIQVADDLLEKNDLEAAIKVYQEALVILPGDSYAAGKVQEISNNMVDAKLLEENFQNSIIKGDQLLKEGKLENALTEYRNASSLKPAETYPKEKAGQVEKLLAEKKAITGDYDSFLQAADLAISRNKYDEAIINLEQAIMLKPDETIPKQKLAEALNLKIAWESYAAIINDADNLYISKDFEKAKEKYLEAQSIMPADEYPKRMLEKIDIALMDLSKANRSSYEFVIALADKLFNQQDYEQAIVEYNSALRFKPDEAYARQRISDINNALSLRKTQEEAYLQSIAKADEQYKEQLYEEARDEYTRATGIKPLEQYPKVKVEEINTLLSKLASQRGVYDNLIKGADRLFFSDEYMEAREQYRGAVDLFPKEQYPKDQITMINEILGIRDKYVKAVTKADQLLYDRKFDEAMREFRNAAGINPEEAYPLQKIKEIETIMADNTKQQKALEDQKRKVPADEDNALTEKEYQEALAAYQKEKVYEIGPDSADIPAFVAADQQYQDIIATADSSLLEEDYRTALADYQSALELKPGEIYAQGKIAEINGILTEIAAKEALDKQYADVISGADKSLQAKDYQKALTSYQSALNLKPGEAYAQGKIAEINGILGEIAAKEALEKQKEALDKQYADIISSADNMLLAKDYQKALTGYQSALNLKPGEAYAQGKIAEINGILGEIAAKEALEKQKEALDKQYADVISGADNALLAKDYQKAVTGYQSALNLKPGEAYAQGKIAEINGILGEIAAKEALEKQKEALDKQYADVISGADNALLAKDYQKALNGYQSAQKLKPGELYAQGKIAEINGILGEIAAKEALEKQYADVISGADNALLAKDYQKALADYQSALNLKPGEPYAQGKITKINGILGEIADKDALEKQQEALDKHYADVISGAEIAFQAKDYQKALTTYQSALNLKPNMPYVQGKINEINRILSEIAAQEAIEKQKEIDINRTLETLAAQRDQAYQLAISKADNYFDQQNYDMAKLQYDRALELKPDELYPLDKMKVVNEQIMKKKQIIQEEYDKTIIDADRFYTSKIYDNAIDSYRASSVLKTEEEYPREMVRRILKLLSERSIVQINKDPLLIANNTQHKFEFIPVPVKDRKSNYIFFRARNVSKVDYKLIISFGKDQTKNGGIVVKVPAGEDLYEFVVRISAQYKWFSDDNNWITFYPEGGDFEVSLLQISYSD